MENEEYAFAYNINSTGMSGIITMTNPPKLVCYCDEENSKTILNALNPHLPPAEGAEDFLKKYTIYCKNVISIEGKTWVLSTVIPQAMQEFATLHAQRIAEKMVEERMREELIGYDKFLSNTYWGISHIIKCDEAVDEYLKTRKK